MISYKEYPSEKLFDLIHNHAYLKELYKIHFKVDKVPKIYIQQIKDVLFRNYPNSHIFLAVNEKKPVAFLTGSVTHNSFSIDQVSVSKDVSSKEVLKNIEGKLLLRSIAYMRVNKKITNFAPSYLLSNNSKLMFRAIASRKNSSSLHIVPDNKFAQNKDGFTVFKKDKNIKNKINTRRK